MVQAELMEKGRVQARAAYAILYCAVAQLVGRAVHGSGLEASAGQEQGEGVAIVVAAVLDGLDGRVARLLKGSTKFGAELDSLSDFANFGVVPVTVLYLWHVIFKRGGP